MVDWLARTHPIGSPDYGSMVTSVDSVSLARKRDREIRRKVTGNKSYDISSIEAISDVVQATAAGGDVMSWTVTRRVLETKLRVFIFISQMCNSG